MPVRLQQKPGAGHAAEHRPAHREILYPAPSPTWAGVPEPDTYSSASIGNAHVHDADRFSKPLRFGATERS